ncbi:4Fe-4S dicluster domain-containing protein [Heliobacterium gestii]|uniref:4Fe-4S dicluster domain-containing protein n=1 Tax=Heliomicrobium gestii TaxID=2699 RepID=A0A845LMH2_HELGE|nr:4Fe-4S binding protein [Heliomicrobium gestii]MBM7867693.1 pyruvate ferredoxin oxidoreductase delta subunit [Heliomicrobium gestii]MZP44086.1 4Fe-4S dicluster domain-containing protein [Heliomicrobium gestii]
MRRPHIRPFPRPVHIRDYPCGPHFQAGHLVDNAAGWRLETPEINGARCVNCLRCYLACPEGALYRSEKAVRLDKDFCKGCGICASECPLQAIQMGRDE